MTTNLSPDPAAADFPVLLSGVSPQVQRTNLEAQLAAFPELLLAAHEHLADGADPAVYLRGGDYFRSLCQALHDLGEGD